MTEQAVAPNSGGYWLRTSTNGASLDGVSIVGNTGSYDTMASFGASAFSSSVEISAPPGKHTLGATCRIEFFRGTFGSDGATLLYRVDRTVTAPFEVVPPGKLHPLQPVFDPKMDAAMRASIRPGQFRFDAQPKWIAGTIDINNAPANVAFDVFVRYGNFSYAAGSLAQVANNGSCTCGLAAPGVSAPPPTIDIVLRPSEKAARDTVDIVTYWDREIVLANIPVSTEMNSEDFESLWSGILKRGGF
jgi:hypothetical protein